MEKMLVKVPVAVKAKVTEPLKKRIIADLEKGIEQIKLEMEQFEFSAKRAINEQENNEQRLVPSLRQHIDAERSKRLEAKEEIEAKLERAHNLEIGAEIGHGTLERTVELEIGTNLDKLTGAEIVTEDGKIIAFRE